MTIATQWDEIKNNITVLYNKLYTLLNKYQADITSDMTFEELCWAVESIPGKVYPQSNNQRPLQHLTYNPNGSIIHKDIYVYKKIRYYMEILSYALIYKGVSQYQVYRATTLSELIELINQIEGLHESFLALNYYNDTFYYNTYEYIEYTLVDENNNDISEGNIVIKQNNIIINYIPGQYALKILPNIISDGETYEIYYEGTDGYLESNHITIVVPIKAPKISLAISTINKSLSNRYDNITSNDIVFDTDNLEITVKVTNPLAQSRPMSNIPVVIQLPNSNNIYHTIAKGITNEDGIFTTTTNINVHNSELEHIYIYSESQVINNENISNNHTQKEIFVKWSPLKIDNYKFHLEESHKTVQIFYRNIDTGELTTEYNQDKLQITNDNQTHTYTLLPSGVSTSSSFECEENVVGSYVYTYTLLRNNQIYYQITNIIKINPLININLYIPDKLLKTSTDTLDCIVEVLDYNNNPIELSNGVYLCTTYNWSCTEHSQSYNINNHPTTIQLPISYILQHCNGFFIQAISVDDKDVYSNIIYVRNHLQNELTSTLTLNTVQSDYTLGDTIINTSGTLIDEENNPVNRNVHMNIIVNDTVVQSYVLVPDYTGYFAKDITILEEWLGYDITIMCSLPEDINYYDNSDNIQTVLYTKANINYWNVTNVSNTVYEECNSIHTIGLSENSIYNQYIDGTIIYEDTEITINDNSFQTTVLPMQAGTYNLSINYSGNRYYNSLTYNIDINIDKTQKYNFDVILNKDTIKYGETITFTPLLEGTTDVTQSFTGVITYIINNQQQNINYNNPYQYTPMQAGTYNIDITYNGDSNHESKTIEKTFTVQKITPAIEWNVQTPQPTYRNDIDYKKVLINYINNDYNLNIKIYDNDTLIYDTDEVAQVISLPITTTGQHTIKLQTDETNIYNSYVLEKEIELYDFVDELYKIVQDMLDEEDYDDNYLIAQKSEQVIDCLLNNDDEYDEDTLEGLYKTIDAMEDI